MRRCSPPLHYLAAAMSARPLNQGRGRGRGGGGGGRGTAFNRRGIGYSYSNSSGSYVTGDAHFQSVHDVNRGLREREAAVPSGGFRLLNPRPPPPAAHNRNQDFSQPFRRRPPPPDQYRSRGSNNRSQGLRPRPWDYRVWEYAKTPPPPDAERFVVLSYNILADYLANEHGWKLYKHIPRFIMDWNWRKKNILFELGLWSPDIMCFQEVDRFDDLDEELKQRGYSGIWKMRTGNAIDGCAVFWKTSRFKLLKEESIEFNKLGLRDNVAQICVLELQSHYPLADTCMSSSCSNKIVICNIHVLYNPKRGEIKLGQVRLLLEKAYAISELWDNAPVIVCGDFNCTPKSPLYNFIAEKKLDLSGVYRDKVSGQASATIHFPKSQVSGAAVSPISSKSPYSNFNQDPPREDLEFQKLNSPQKGWISRPLSSECSQLPQTVVSAHTSSSECISEQQTIVDSLLHNEQTNEIQRVSSTVGSSDKHPKTEEHADSSRDVIEHGEKVTALNSNIQGECEPSHPYLCSGSTSSIYLSSQEVDDEGSLFTKAQSNFSNGSSVYHDVEDEVENVSEELRNLSLVRTMEEDKETSLCALHDVNDPLLPDTDELVDPDPGSPQDESTLSHSDEILNDLSPGADSEIASVDKTIYNPSLWTPMEIATATGEAQCTLMEHHLVLTSTYTEVEDTSRTRDSNREPLATSYNRCFLGTVDYIWRSEGLQTIKVLAPLPKDPMQQTGGFPTKKWGSDHVALASELAFTRGSIQTMEDRQHTNG